MPSILSWYIGNMNIKKYIAIAVALVVVLIALVPQARHWVSENIAHINVKPLNTATTTGPGSLSGFSVPVLTFGNIGATPVAIEAWGVFQNYLVAAKSHDIAYLKSLSYQISPACEAALTDKTKTADCEELMDSVVFFTQRFKQSDFVRVAYDDKQIVLATEYIKISDAEELVKTVIYFVHLPAQAGDGSPKVLGIRFCVGEEGESDECVETSAEKRDSDQDGWWDDVESLFKK